MQHSYKAIKYRCQAHNDLEQYPRCTWWQNLYFKWERFEFFFSTSKMLSFWATSFESITTRPSFLVSQQKQKKKPATFLWKSHDSRNKIFGTSFIDLQFLLLVKRVGVILDKNSLMSDSWNFSLFHMWYSCWIPKPNHNLICAIILLSLHESSPKFEYFPYLWFNFAVWNSFNIDGWGYKAHASKNHMTESNIISNLNGNPKFQISRLQFHLFFSIVYWN
jgi:hypothetical protein